MKYQYYKNDYMIITFYPEEKILRIEANNVTSIGSVNKDFTTYTIKPKKMFSISTIIKISSNRFHDFGFNGCNLCLNIHNVEKENITKFVNGFIIN